MHLTTPSHWTQGELAVNQAHLHYYRTGSGDLPALVLMHGFSDDGLCWMQTALDLEAQYDILMPDARGHGYSERVKPGEQVDLAADLAGLITALCMEKPIIAGHSMGAMIASQVGARFPTLARAIILEDPPWFHRPPVDPQVVKTQGNSIDDFARSLAHKTAEALMDECRSEHPTWPEVVVQTWCGAKKRLDQNFLATRSMQLADWPEIAKAITCPTLVFTAEPDLGGIVTPAVAQEIRALNPRITLVHIPGVGHHIRFGDYTSYMQIFRSFLNEVQPATP
jgi:N-formylmaleamate deformylase